MNEAQQHYYSFLLRVWQVKENEHTVWRLSLESSHTGKRWGFGDLDAMCAFLHQQMAMMFDLEAGGFESIARDEGREI